MRLCDGIIANPQGIEEIQMKAMDILIRAVQVCYRIVSDVEVEQFEREVEALKEREEQAAEKGRINYRIEEDQDPPR